MNIARARDEIENKGGEKMEDNRERDFLKLLGAKGTREILELMDQHGTVQYKQMMQFVNTPTLNQRLRDLLIFGLISHHLEKIEPRNALKVFGAKGTKKVLEFLDEHGRAQFKEMGVFMNLGTLNYRLNELLDLGLVTHHLERKPKKTEWYEITEKGKQALEYLRALVELTAGSS